VPEYLLEISREVTHSAKLVAQKFPKQFTAFLRIIEKEAGGGQRASPEHRFSAHVLAMVQRKTTDSMATLLPSRPVSYERDALVVVERSLDQAAISAALGFQVKVSAYPSEAQVLASFELQHPFMDFKMKSRFPSAQLSVVEVPCIRALEPVLGAKGRETFKTPDNTTNFGTLVAGLWNRTRSRPPAKPLSSGRWSRALVGG
jgi:hypothetical protein